MNFYENTRWQKTSPTSAAGTAAPSRSCDSRRANVPDRGVSHLWCGTDIDLPLAQGAPKGWRCSPEGAQAWPQTSISSGRSSSRNHRPLDHRPVSQSTETSLCPVDPRRGTRVDRKTMRSFGFSLDGGSLSETLGLYATETASSRLRARPRSGPTLAGTRLSCDASAGPHRTCPDPLGRRNGDAFRSSGWAQLWSQGANAGHSRNRPAVRLQYDFDDYEPGSIDIYGLQGAIRRVGDDRLSSATDKTKQAESLFDCGWSSGASFQTGQTLGSSASKKPPVVLPAGVQSAVESGRTSQSGRQDQCGGPATPEQSAGNAATGSVVSEKYSTPTSNCQKLF